MKSEKVKKCIIVAIGIIFLIVVIFIGMKIVNNANGKSEVFEPEWGPLRDGEGSALIEKLEAELCVDGKYPSYYGGCYLKKQNLVILMTIGSEEKEDELKGILEQEEGIYVRYVEHSLNDLEEANEQFATIYKKTYEQGEKSKIQLLNDITGSGVRQESNEVVIGVKNLTWKKEKQLKEIFGEDEKIRYENSGSHTLLMRTE